MKVSCQRNGRPVLPARRRILIVFSLKAVFFWAGGVAQGAPADLRDISFAGAAAADSTSQVSLHADLAVDAGLWLGTLGMESYWQQPAGLGRFPSNGLDIQVRKALHGGHVSDVYTPRETAWRNYSDGGIGLLVAGSVAAPFLSTARGLGVHESSGADSLAKVSRAFAVNNFACTLLKNAVHRSRPKPTLSESVPQGDDNAKSFPSSHASNAMVAASSIALLTPGASSLFHAAIYTAGASIGIARILADRHFFTDVLVGGAIGAGITHWVFSGAAGNTELAFAADAVVIQTRF